MAKIKFTTHQQNAIDVEGGNVLVSAAAGSGKTAVLTQRVINLLTKENPISADRLVIVTFTVAAAEEMKRRISSKLSDLIEQNPHNKTYQTQQMLLSSAKICTIHSLCSSLIKDNFQKLGLSSDIKIADETQMTLIKNQAVEELLEDLYEKEDKRFLDLFEFLASKNDKKLSDLMLSIYDFIRSFSFPLKFLDQALEMYSNADSIENSIWADSVLVHVDSALKQAEDILKSSVLDMESDEKVFSAYSSAFMLDITNFSEIRKAVNKKDFDKIYTLVNNLSKARLSSVRNYDDKEYLEMLQSKRKKAYSILDELLKRYLCFSNQDFKDDINDLFKHNETLFNIIKQLYALIEEKKKEASFIDYSDLEHYALKLLINETENGYEKSITALEMSQNIDEIMVDECQDINEVQNLIFKLLSKDEENLFMVGDVKQSIYRFRKAMPTLFIEKMDTFLDYDKEKHNINSKSKIILETNFRSRKEVCDIINYIFNQIMTREMGELDYTQAESLVPGASYEKNDEAYPEVHIIDYSNENEDEKTVVEAKYIAKLIKKMVNDGYMVTENSVQRKCQYSDFAILLRSKKDKAIKYANELKALSIPFFSDTTEGYFDEYEITLILNFLRIIDNPLLDLPMLSVLMSPIIAFSPDSVTEIKLKYKNVPLYIALTKMAEEGHEQSAKFIELIKKIRQNSITMSVSEVIGLIYDETDFFSVAHAMGNGEQKNANLRLLLIHASQYESNGTSGLSGFLRYIDRVIENKSDFSCSNVISDNNQSVKIMSIHSSKGLEFPICIVADCGKKFNKMDINSYYQLNSQLGFSMKINDVKTLRSYSNFPFEAIRLKSEKETISEEMRVFYVALTRAREKLITVMTLSNVITKLQNIADTYTSSNKPTPYEVYSANGYYDWLLITLLKHPSFYNIRKQIERSNIPLVSADFDVKGYLINSSEICDEVEEAVENVESDIDDKLADELKTVFNSEYKYEPLTKIPAKLTVTQIAKKDNENINELKKRPNFMEFQGFTSAQKGTILHDFMQFANYENASLDLDKEIKRLVDNGYITMNQATTLNKNKIKAFLNSNLYERMKQSEKVVREYKFLHFISAKSAFNDIEEEFSNQEILIQGIADALFFEEDGIVLIDYKTDFVTDEDILKERYFNQLKIYKDAIEKSFNTKVKECLIYSLHLEKAIKLDIK